MLTRNTVCFELRLLKQTYDFFIIRLNRQPLPRSNSRAFKFIFNEKRLSKILNELRSLIIWNITSFWSRKRVDFKISLKVENSELNIAGYQMWELTYFESICRIVLLIVTRDDFKLLTQHKITRLIYWSVNESSALDRWPATSYSLAKYFQNKKYQVRFLAYVRRLVFYQVQKPKVHALHAHACSNGPFACNRKHHSEALVAWLVLHSS